MYIAPMVDDAVRYRVMIGNCQTYLRSARRLIDRLLGDIKWDLRELAEPYIDEKVQIEVMAKRFDRLVPRHPNRPLVVTENPDELPTRLTVILKSLFVRYLDTGQPDTAPGARGASLLVTAEVQSGKDVGSEGGKVSPIILEEFFSPGHFVNARDRIVYGPKVYRGEFLNVKLSVVRLSNVNDSALGEGLGMAMDSISKFNPGLAAVSPFVSSFFKGVFG